MLVILALDTILGELLSIAGSVWPLINILWQCGQSLLKGLCYLVINGSWPHFQFTCLAVRSSLFFSQLDNSQKTYLERAELDLPSFVLILYENSNSQNKGVGQRKHAVN